MTISIERLPTSAFIRDAAATDEYRDVNKLHPLFDSIGYGSGVVLVGPKGIGKSLSVASYAASKKLPLVTFDCSEDVRRAQLIGAYVIRGNETPFVLGPIPTAIEIANETGVCVLAMEELNTLTPQMQKVLNAICDFRRRVEVPEAKAVYGLKEGAKLLITGTMNHAGYGGVYDLNEDLKSRLNLVPLTYPGSADEKKILDAYQKKHALKVSASQLNGMLTLAHETRQQAMEYALSTRDLTQLMYNVDKVGVEQSLWIMSGKFEGRDRETFGKRVQSVFGVDLAE
jgi:MoxR-like ATPase